MEMLYHHCYHNHYHHSPLLFNSALEYAIRKLRENQVRLKLNGTNQLLTYAYDVNLLGDNRYYKQKQRNFI
jgi:hypothetical protein